MCTDKRIYVGGLFPDVTKTDLTERFSSFGEIKDVELKVKNDGTAPRTFAYVTLSTTEDKLQKCVSIYNRSKWKGSELKLELAKESFLSRLVKERQSPESMSKPERKKSAHHNPLERLTDVQDYSMPNAVPGTSIPGEKNWVVGKYGRILPIVHMEDKSKRKIVKVDPSKYCHNIKKLKADVTECDDTEQLTWNFDGEETEIDRRRQGEFPAWQPVPKTKQVSSDSPVDKNQDNSFEFEIVSVEKKKTASLNTHDDRFNNKKVGHGSKPGRIMKESKEKVRNKQSVVSMKDTSTAETGLSKEKILKQISKRDQKSTSCNSDDSVNSDDTDEIIKMSKNQIHQSTSLDPTLSDSEHSVMPFGEISNIYKRNITEKNILSEKPNVKKSRQSFESEQICSTSMRSEPKKKRLQEFGGTKLLLSNSGMEDSKMKSAVQIDSESKKTVVDISSSTKRVNSSLLNKTKKYDEMFTKILQSQITGNMSKQNSKTKDSEKSHKCKRDNFPTSECSDCDKKDKFEGKKSLDDMPVSANKNRQHSDLEKSLKADKKRLESVKQRHMENLTQKSIIQNALKSIDHASSNKKIIFESDEDELEEHVNTASVSGSRDVKEEKNVDRSEDSSSEDQPPSKERKSSNAAKTTLFENSSDEATGSDDEDERFKIKPQFEGAAGKKLMNLQSRYGTDERFKLDERFKDIDSEDDEKSESVGEDEKTRSLKILEGVIGHRLSGPISKQKDKKSSFKDITALRFDPTSDDHSQFEIKSAAETPQPQSKKNKKKQASNEEVEVTPAVSKEKFFEVSDSLKKAFMSIDEPVKEGSSFSLLASYGQQQDEDGSNDSLEELPEKPSFIDQSSDDESEVEMEMDVEDERHEEKKRDSKVMKKSSELSALPGRRLTFFFTEDDDRLKEGEEFYRKESLDDIREKWLEKRPHLIEAYKSKHKKLVRQHKQKRKPFSGNHKRRFSKS